MNAVNRRSAVLTAIVVFGTLAIVVSARLMEYAEFNRDFVSWAQEQMKAGKPADQAATEYRVPAKYKGYTASPNPEFDAAKANTEIVYKELR
jgi:hypothetical protein